MTKMIVFDMDGTIVDLYGVENWLSDLRSENPRPYIEAEPLYNVEELNALLYELKSAGYRIAITSWLAKYASKRYDEMVRTAKREWLDKVGFPYDEIHLVKYGTTKANCTRTKADYQILVDDNAEVRAGWHLGATIDATENILVELKKII